MTMALNDYLIILKRKSTHVKTCFKGGLIGGDGRMERGFHIGAGFVKIKNTRQVYFLNAHGGAHYDKY